MRNMKKTNFLSLILLLVLIAALALTVAGCDGKTDTDVSVTTAETTAATIADEAPNGSESTVATTADPYLRGEGDTEFIFKVVTKSGEEKTFTVRTDKTIVGQALQEVGLIEGEDSQYGLFVKVVDGERVEWDTDGKYWAFYVDGVYALKGVDSTEIEAGKVYSFRAE